MDNIASSWLLAVPNKARLRRIEEMRLQHQTNLNGDRTLSERNRLGQFATPPALADDVLAETKTMMSRAERGAIRLGDPAFGTGSFLTAALRVFGAKNIQTATAMELDPAYVEAAQSIWAGTPLQLVPGDFTTTWPVATRPSLLVCNPPYVRHHHMELQEKKRLQRLSKEVSGVQLNLQAGLYCHFMLLAHQWMVDNALGVWVVPSEILDAKYGIAVRRYLTEKVELLRVHRYALTDLHFSDALVGTAVIWFRKRSPSPRHQVLLTAGSSLTKPRASRHSPIKELLPTEQWTTSFLVRLQKPGNHPTVLSDIFEIKRGLATGANKFFIMTGEQVAKLQLPARVLRPILPMPRKLGVEHVEKGADGHPTNVERLWLFDTTLALEQLQCDFPAVWDYLRRGISEKVDQTHLCSHRKPWYSQEVRPPAPFLSAYVGRSNGTVDGFPVRFILNDSDATATNSYLMLYPKTALAEILDSTPELRIGVWEALRSIGRGPQVRNGRAYGGGLVKLEPAELGQVTAEPILLYLRDSGHNLVVPEKS